MQTPVLLKLRMQLRWGVAWHKHGSHLVMYLQHPVYTSCVYLCILLSQCCSDASGLIVS